MKKGLNRVVLCVAVLAVILTASLSFAAPNTDRVVTYWMQLHPNIAATFKNEGDTLYAQEASKRTGVKIKYLHPAAGQQVEAFNLLLASGDLPDIIEYNWYNIPGGPAGAIKNNYVKRLNQFIDAGKAPYLKAFFAAHPEISRAAKTDSNGYYVFPFVRGDHTLVTAGPVLRKDWLDELGLAAPETIDEWYTVLKAFKEKKDATSPLTATYGNLSPMFAGGFDNFGGFYVDKGVVKYGGVEPNRKQFLATMAKWYKEGLLDKNFATNSSKNIDANILTGKSGATYGSGGSGLGRWIDAAPKGEKYDLCGASFPTPKKGTLPRFSNVSPAFGSNDGSAAISYKSKNADLAVKFLDYNYSEAGNILANFGIEGISYKMVNGYPQYTDLILKNPQGLAPTTILAKYTRGFTNGPFMQDNRYLEQYYAYPQQKTAMKLWEKTDFFKYMLPPVTPNEDESSELAKIMNDINTFTNEQELKTIMGVVSIDQFDKNVAQIQKLGLARALRIYQAAYDRYLHRK